MLDTSAHALATIEATSIASSISPTGQRIDTLKLRYPRMVHADFMTHRVFSRNASSSRAMPSATLLKDEPYVPWFRENKPGMQPGDPLYGDDFQSAKAVWLEAAEACQKAATVLSDKNGLNVHKQWANRMLEWFGYITVVVTATDFANYLALRDEWGAQDEIRWQAQAVRRVLADAIPKELRPGEWHLPFVTPDVDEEVARFCRDETNRSLDIGRATDFAFKNLAFLPIRQRLLMICSTSRCARTSFNNFDGSRMTIGKDVDTFLKLGSSPIHASPFEHQARPAVYQSPFCGNFTGWEQFRKFIPNERASDR